MLAGAPIVTDAGKGPITRMVHESPASFYDLGGGPMKRKFMLQGWKNMHPEQTVQELGYENRIDLPGRWFTQLFKQNRLAKGEFIGLGCKLNLHDITCPTYLLAGASD